MQRTGTIARTSGKKKEKAGLQIAGELGQPTIQHGTGLRTLLPPPLLLLLLSSLLFQCLFRLTISFGIVSLSASKVINFSQRFSLQNGAESKA